VTSRRDGDNGFRSSLGIGNTPRYEVDASVDDDHDTERQVKGADRRVELIPDGLTDGTLARLVDGLAAAEQRRQADQCREYPNEHYHHRHPHRSSLHRVLERSGDDEVAIDADRAQIQYGGRAQEDVERRPRVADGLPEDPTSHHLVHRGEGHDEAGDEQVGDGERDDQKVRGSAKTANDGNRRTHEHVADNCSADDDSTSDDGQRHLPRSVADRRRSTRRRDRGRLVEITSGRQVRRVARKPVQTLVIVGFHVALTGEFYIIEEQRNVRA